MSDVTLYTQFRERQFRGPTDSQDSNELTEENYKDLVVLTNRSRITQADLEEGYARLVKDQLAMVNAFQDLSERLGALEAREKILTFQHASQVDTDRFNGSSFEVVAANKLNVDEAFGLVTLPKVSGASISKLVFYDDLGNVILPSTLETKVVGVTGTADSAGAIIDTSEPELAVAHQTGRIWQRNVILDSPRGGGAQMYVYIKAPTDLFAAANSNAIIIYPFPAINSDILEIAYTVNQNVMLDDSDSYTALNSTAMHDGDTQAVGWIPPGGWEGDQAYNAGPRIYYFDPIPVTGIRIKLGQRNYFTEGSHVIYTYGLSNLDLRYDKFVSTGTGMIRFDAPEGKTISEVVSIEPQVFNVSEAELPNVFEYSIIWETAYNSGTFTNTPVPLSKRVWIQVSLSATTGNGSPAISGLNIKYN